MVETVNVLMALLTIAFGAFGFIAPKYTAAALDLAPSGSNMGYSEMRASVGGLFVALGGGALILHDPLFYFAIGIGFTGAAIGRVLSICFDAPPIKKVLLFGGIEAVMAAWLVAANINAV